MKTTLLFLTLGGLFLLTSCSNDDGGGGNMTPNPEPEPLEIGDLHQGGIIFYLDESGEQGLVVSLQDQSDFATWCSNAEEIDGADGESLGDGAQNTSDIISACDESNTAAARCDNLNSNGFADWYLPSIGELEEIANNIAVINAALEENGGTSIALETYWSSTELNFGNVSSAQTYSFEFDVAGGLTKFGSAYVRAVRAFD